MKRITREHPSARYSLMELTRYFLKLGTLGFGGPVALIGYMHRDLVEDRKWITEDEYREGLALAQLAPGPLAAQLGIYLGYVHYGVWGATLTGLALAALGVFLPCFVFTVLPAPYFKKIAKNESIKAFVDGITAAVVGALVGSVFVIATRSIVDITSALIALASILGLIYVKKLQEPYIILAAAIIGYCLKTYL